MTKTSCINLSINVCRREFPPPSSSMACRSSSANQHVCECMCVPPWAWLPLPHAALASVVQARQGCFWRSGACVHIGDDRMQPLPPLLLPLLPFTKTLVLSASALRSRCGISQRTKLQSDQLFKLQVSASGETRCSCVYLVFAHLFFVFFFPSLQVAKNALKKTQKLRVKYELTEVYEMYECVWSIGKGPSFSLWGSQAWCFHALHIKRAGTPRHQSVKHRRRLLPFSSERSSVCFMEQWLQGGRFVHLLFSELENLDTDLLKKSLQMWGGKKPLEMNCGAAVYICHWY